MDTMLRGFSRALACFLSAALVLGASPRAAFAVFFRRAAPSPGARGTAPAVPLSRRAQFARHLGAAASEAWWRARMEVLPESPRTVEAAGALAAVLAERVASAGADSVRGVAAKTVAAALAEPSGLAVLRDFAAAEGERGAALSLNRLGRLLGREEARSRAREALEGLGEGLSFWGTGEFKARLDAFFEREEKRTGEVPPQAGSESEVGAMGARSPPVSGLSRAGREEAPASREPSVAARPPAPAPSSASVPEGGRSRRIVSVLAAGALTLFGIYRLATKPLRIAHYRDIVEQGRPLSFIENFDLNLFNDFLTVPVCAAVSYMVSFALYEGGGFGPKEDIGKGALLGVFRFLTLLVLPLLCIGLELSQIPHFEWADIAAYLSGAALIYPFHRLAWWPRGKGVIKDPFRRDSAVMMSLASCGILYFFAGSWYLPFALFAALAATVLALAALPRSKAVRGG